MTTAEAIDTLADLRYTRNADLTVQECHAIGIAMVVLIALEPSQRDMVDALLAMPDASSN